MLKMQHQLNVKNDARILAVPIYTFYIYEILKYTYIYVARSFKYIDKVWKKISFFEKT